MDVYFKKEITYPFSGHKFKFDVANTLFSTFEMDHGTDVLIRAIESINPKTILDLGCGYGPLGIILATKYPQSEVTMVDVNLLAVRYTKLNIEKNNVNNAIVMGGVAMEQVMDKTFDLIVSNILAKIGDKAIAQDFIITPYTHLNPGGELWIVVVNALNHLIPRVGSKNNLNMREVKKRIGHTVYKIEKPNNMK